MKSSKLNERSRWLLLYMAHRPFIETSEGPQQIGMASTSSVPNAAPPGVCLGTMRGLEKRGYVREKGYGSFYITDAGKKRAEEESLLHGGMLAFQMGADCQCNGGHFEEYRPQLAGGQLLALPSFELLHKQPDPPGTARVIARALVKNEYGTEIYYCVMKSRRGKGVWWLMASRFDMRMSNTLRTTSEEAAAKWIDHVERGAVCVGGAP